MKPIAVLHILLLMEPARMSLHPWHSSSTPWRLLHSSTPGWEIKTTTVSSSPSCVLLITEIGVPYSSNEMARLNKEQMLIIVNVCLVACYFLQHNTGQVSGMALWPHSRQRGTFLSVFPIHAYSEGKSSLQTHRPLSRVMTLDVIFHLHQLYKITEMSNCTAEAV